MARIRNVKPDLFKHAELADLERESGLPLRVAWIGLFCQADWEGRFRCKARELKLEVLPWDDVDFEAVLAALERGDFIRRYEVDGKTYAVIPNFGNHQRFSGDETKKPSVHPAPPEPAAAPSRSTDEAVATQVERTHEAPANADLGLLTSDNGQGTRAGAQDAPSSPPEGAKPRRGRSHRAEPPPDDAPEGVCRTWVRLWTERHGTDYVPSHFCYIDGVALGSELTPDQVPLLEPAMRAFQGDPKTRLQQLNKFCRVAAGLIAAEAARRSPAKRASPEAPPEPQIDEAGHYEQVERLKAILAGVGTIKAAVP